MNETTKKNTPLGLCMTYSHHPVSNITVGKRLMFVLLLDSLVTKNSTKKCEIGMEVFKSHLFFLVDLKKWELNRKIYLHLQARPSVISGDPLLPTWQHGFSLERSRNRKPQIHTTPKRFQEELANSSPRVAKCHLQNPCFLPQKWTPRPFPRAEQIGQIGAGQYDGMKALFSNSLWFYKPHGAK